MALSCCKKLSALLKGKTSKHKGDFYCLNCFHSYSTKEKPEKHKNVCENNDYWYVDMPKEVILEILKYNHGYKSMKVPFTIYVDLEYLLEKMNTCHNNPEKYSTTNINQHTASGYSFFTYSSFDTTENKLDCYRGKDCMIKFCKVLKKHVTRIINYEKKRNDTLKRKEKKVHNKQKELHMQKKKKIVLMIITKNTINSETILIILKNIEELLMIFVI